MDYLLHYGTSFNINWKTNALIPLKMPEITRYTIAAGLLLIVIGLGYWWIGNRIDFLGKLPGDIRIERENYRIYIPITTMLLISVIIQLIIWILRWWKR
jgi:hypothetical protein